MAQRPQELPEKPDGLVAKPVTASEPPTFSPPSEPDVLPVIGPLAELPTTTAPLPPPPVETLEQADKRLQAAAEQAWSSAEHQAVGQELLSLVEKAILDSEIELAKRIVERALAAASQEKGQKD